MIHRDEMMSPMLEACPSFSSAWQEFISEWHDDPKGLPIYLALGDLARHLIGMLERGDTKSFPAIFAVVERWHIDGEHYVREAATVGLLEGLQNTNLHGSTRPEQFLPFLRPESLKWWKKLIGFWERGEIMKDE